MVITWPDCVTEPPHIIADPCKPRWVVKCSHGEWFYAKNRYWEHKRDEKEAYFALITLFGKLIRHSRAVTNGV